MRKVALLPLLTLAIGMFAGSLIPPARAAGADLDSINTSLGRMLDALKEISRNVDNLEVKTSCECRCK